MSWEQDFIRRFDNVPGKSKRALALSVKVRTKGGCFHREHAPKTFKAIDRTLSKYNELVLEEHETGPEWLTFYVAATVGAVTIAKHIFDVVVTCMKEAREGVKKGDKSEGPFEVIVRCQLPNKEYREQILVTVTQKTNIEKRFDAKFEREVADLIDGWVEEDKRSRES